MKYGLIGEKLSHSYSQKIHRSFGDYPYELEEVPRGEFDAFMRKKDFKAINVTIPYKRDVLPYLDELSPIAAGIGAVNTVVNDGGRLIGYNTDFFGFSMLLDHAGIDVAGKNAIILGSGGTRCTVEAVLNSRHARSVRVVSRTGALNYDNVCDLKDVDIVINASPCGMYPDSASRPLDLSCFDGLSGVVDVIYNPVRTRLVLQAQRLGIPCGGGLMMLVAQAARACKLFTGADNIDIYGAYAQLKRSVSDIVLIGMPGCGKSTLGRRVAQLTGREFVDTDGIIEMRTGKTIGEIFAEKGEAWFRKLESAVIGEVAAGGKVIATGGGAVLDGANVERLKNNGRLYYVRRALTKLAKKGRPLSLAASAEELFAARRPLYEAAADATVDNDGDIAAAAAFIAEDFIK